MNPWSFEVLDIRAAPYAAAPELTARLRVTEGTGTPVHAIALHCQVRIEPQRRGYDAQDEAGLRALFDQRSRWSETLRPFQWMQCDTTVQGFRDQTEVDLPLPCTYDFDVTGSRYLHAVGGGSVPLSLLFSGTAFLRGQDGFAVQQIPWDCEARFELPVAVWRQMIATYFPGTGWIRMDHDVVAELAAYRARQGLMSWDEAVTRLLADVSVLDGTP